MARPLVESALLAALGAILVLFAFYVPVLGTVVALVSPLPVAMVAIRHGWRWSLLASIVSALALILFIDWITAIGLWVVYGWVGLAFGISVKKGYSASIVLLITALALFLGTVAGFALSYLVTGITISDFAEEMIRSFQMALEMNEKVLGPNPVLEELAKTLAQKDVILKLFPASFALSSLALAFINIEVFRRVMPRFGYNLEPLPPFSRWVFPEILGWAGLLSFAAVAYVPYPALKATVENLYPVVSVLGIVEVLSLLSFYLSRLDLPRIMTTIAVFFALTIMFTTPAISMLAPFFGMIDMLFDFRRIRSHLSA